MKLLVVTNLYPPQELGGYGRCISDFVWGLVQLGHQISVLCSDAPYLGPSDQYGPTYETVNRSLHLLGSFDSGVSMYQEPDVCNSINNHNLSTTTSILCESWDGVIVGNLDLLGPHLLSILLSIERPVLHHIGFVVAPYPLEFFPFHC